MRFATFLTGVAAVAIAVSAAAQNAPSSPPEKAAGSDFGLSDLSGTVNQLSDQRTSEAQAAAEPQAATGAVPQAETAAAQVSSAPAPATGTLPPLDSEQRAEMARAAARGRQIFAIARAGMLATQDMLSRVADPAAAGISGWIAEPEGNAMLVTFYSDSDGGPVAVYRARVLGGRAVSRETFLTGDRPRLAGLAERMARARSGSESDEHRACTDQPFNVIAIPPAAADGPIDVYRLSAPASRSRLPLGGHFRSTVAADGNVTETRGFSRGCLNVDVGEVAPGTQAGPIAVTHLLDPLPTEIHVFLSLFSGRPLVIAAGDPTRLFMVAGDAIREMRR
ncbi:MAG TPA: hypothetical protein VFO69_14005 [Allosphingosinicella sp.]|nr:hypothetical protein [Allosphingosinicella sp.]